MTDSGGRNRYKLQTASRRFRNLSWLRKFETKTHMASDEQSRWECRFCFERLRPYPLSGWKRLLYVFAIRKFKCPHCFNMFVKPIDLVARIPFVGKLFCEKSNAAASIGARIRSLRTGRSKREQKDRRKVGFLLRLGHQVSLLERRVSDCVGTVFRACWLGCLWPLHRLSRKLTRLGKSKSRERRRKSSIGTRW